MAQSDAELVSAAIAASGLSVRKFARRFFRNPSTVWKWLRGEHPPPSMLKDEFRRIIAESQKPAS
jgi:DNA-binding transcriptional regulator YiaG